jgi:hypothetical protein
MEKTRVSGAVFTYLHSLILEQFKKECSEHGTDADYLEKFQVYGYKPYDPSRPNLPSYIADNERVAEYLQKKEKSEINGQYLYSRINRFRQNQYAAPVTLAGIYSKIYFLYLGFEDIDDFVENMPEGINRPTEQEIDIQRYLNGKPRPLEEKEKYIAHYYCAYYTKMRQAINVLDMSIDFTPALVDPADSEHPTYKVFAKEIPTSKNQFSPSYKLKIFEGIAVDRKDTLSISLTDRGGEEDRLIILTIGVKEEDTEHKKFSDEVNPLEKLNDIRGAYCGRSSFNNQVIAGEMLVTRIYKSEKRIFDKNKDEIHTVLDAFDPFYLLYLRLRASQVRSIQEPITPEVIKQKLTEMGYGPKLSPFLGKHYRLFVLKNDKTELSEIALRINEDYSYQMVMSNGKKYEGNVRIIQEDILAFEKTHKGPPKEEDPHFFGQAYVEIVEKPKDGLFKGVFDWRADEFELTSGQCAIIHIDSPTTPVTYRNDSSLDPIALKAKELLKVVGAALGDYTRERAI